MGVRSILRDVMTESDGVTHDLYRYLSVVSVVVGLTLAAYTVIEKSQPFSMQEFGIGIGALLAGVGVALGLKKEGAQ